jgi:hypothetical protein
VPGSRPGARVATYLLDRFAARPSTRHTTPTLEQVSRWLSSRATLTLTLRVRSSTWCEGLVSIHGGQTTLLRDNQREMDLDDAYRRLVTLRASLYEIQSRDQEQEVRGQALEVLDAVIAAAKQHVDAGDPVLARIYDVLSPETIAGGEPPRAIDLLVVVDQLLAILERKQETPDMTIEMDLPFGRWEG